MPKSLPQCNKVGAVSGRSVEMHVAVLVEMEGTPLRIGYGDRLGNRLRW